MDDFNVQINDRLVNNHAFQSKFKKLLTGPKVVFLLLGIIVLAEVVYAVKALVLSRPISSPLLPQLKQNAAVTQQKKSGSISLTTAKTTFNVKEAIAVSVKIDTGTYSIDGADLIVHFDPQVLDISSEGLVKGSIFDEYPLVTVNAKKGIISISGISSLKNAFSGKGKLAALNFTAKNKGQTMLTVDFTKKGVTTDSNLVAVGTSKDILEQVNNLELKIQ